MGAPLASLRVLELSDGVALSYCARQLAVWGAEVVLVEESEGSPLRREGPFVSDGDCRDRSVQWEYLSASKQILTLPQAHGDLSALLSEADLVLTDWPEAKLERVRIQSSTLGRKYPSLVSVFLSDFGDGGAYAKFRATDLILQALTGYIGIHGERDKAPLKAPANIIPYAIGMSCLVGALAALVSKQTSGVGQTVRVASVEAVATLVQYMRTQYFGAPSLRPGSITHRLVPCSDGYLFVNYMLDYARDALALALDVPRDSFPESRDERFDFVVSKTQSWSARQLCERLRELGATCSAVQDLQEVLADPHLAERGFFADYELGGRTVKFPGAPLRIQWTGPTPPAPAQPWRGWQRARSESRRVEPTSHGKPPLSGTRVVDLTQAWIGPFATMLLADLGADVIKIESPTRPDVWRNASEVPPIAREGAHRWNTCHFFNSVNRNKRSLTLDLDTHQGKEILIKLVRDTDLLMENFTPRVMENFGLTFEALHRANPGLVMVSFSGYGGFGPYRNSRATGASIEPVAGWSALFGYPDGGPMTMGENPLDPMAGLHMAASALIGLYGRRRSGSAQHIEGSMLEAAAGYIGDELMYASATGASGSRLGNRHRAMAPHGVYRCAGPDEWIAIAVQDDDEWLRLIDLIGDERLQAREFRRLDRRLNATDQLDSLLTEWTSQHHPQELMHTLQGRGVTAGAVQFADRALDDPQLSTWFRVLEHPDTGAQKHYGFAWSFSGCSLSLRLPPPRLGEHSAQVLERELRLTPDEIDQLISEGVSSYGLEHASSGD